MYVRSNRVGLNKTSNPEQPPPTINCNTSLSHNKKSKTHIEYQKWKSKFCPSNLKNDTSLSI